LKNILQLISLLFIGTIVVSCQKDRVNPGPIIPPIITPHDSVTRLSKLFFIDTEVSSTDTLRYAEYLYDSLLRVTKVNWYEYNNNSPLLMELIVWLLKEPL
jgi:hypothetical protein